MTRGWQIGDVVKLFEGPYSTGTIIAKKDGMYDVARPYLYAHETGGYSTGVEIVRGVTRLVAAETDREGNPRSMVLGVYTYEDLKKVARGEWKIET